MRFRKAATFLTIFGLIFCAEAHTARSHSEKAAFQREQPCPSTGQRRGNCPGYVVDHVSPLCAGGPDHRSNMQWQTAKDAKAKDRWERQVCRRRP